MSGSVQNTLLVLILTETLLFLSIFQMWNQRHRKEKYPQMVVLVEAVLNTLDKFIKITNQSRNYYPLLYRRFPINLPVMDWLVYLSDSIILGTQLY